jgi:hypothetical protein
MIFLATIKNKELDFGSPFNLARWHEFCKKYEGETVRIDKPEKKRTLSQNNFYWFYLGVIAKETGNEPEDLHIFFRQKLLPRRFIKIKGKKGSYEIEDYKSTTKLTKLEMGEYLEKICAITEVPLPNPVDAGYYK